MVSVLGRFRDPVSPSGFVRLAAGSVAALGLVVMSGAFVRLTGSGLGCDNWPRCGDTPFPAKDFHAMVEFGNRFVALCGILFALATWLAARRVAGLPRSVERTALAAFAGTVAQIPLGGLTVILDLHPLAVMSHFLLALAVVALAVVVALEAWSHWRGLASPVAPPWLRAVAAIGVVSCAFMVVTGAVATASGPHPGADDAVERLGLEIRDTVYVHVRATAVFGIGLLLVGLAVAPRPPPCTGNRPPGAAAARSPPRPDARGRDPVPERPPLGPRARPRHAGRRNLGPHSGDRVRPVAAAARTRGAGGSTGRGRSASRCGRADRRYAVLMASEDLRMSERPTLRRPVMITAFRGWNDGGQAATVAAGYLAQQWDATRFADIDPEGFVDFQAVRPTVSLDAGLTRRIEWPENAFFHAAIPGTGP